MDHPTLETMAKWLAGRLEHEVVLLEIAPHLQERCPICHDHYEQIRRLSKEGMWVRSPLRAPAVLAGWRNPAATQDRAAACHRSPLIQETSTWPPGSRKPA